MTEFYLYLDESGEDNLAKVDNAYPVFILGAVVIEKLYHDTVAHRAFHEFKLSQGLTPGIVLHTADITRAKNGYQFIADPTRRNHFKASLSELIESIDFTFLSALLDKPGAVKKWGTEQHSPYVYLMTMLIERVYLSLKQAKDAHVTIIAEARQPHQDALVQAEFTRTVSGATYIRPVGLLGKMFNPTITFLGKSANPGAEIADLCVTAIGRWYLGKESQIVAREVIDAKTYKHPATGSMDGYGRIAQPKIESLTPV